LALAGDEAKPTPAGGPEALSDQDRARFEAAAAYSDRYAGRVVLIQRGGEVVFERAVSGWSTERPHPLASGTKSFTGVLAMMAVQDGLLTLDELASDTLSEWKSDERKSKITVRQLLTLSSGLTPGDAKLTSGGGGRLLGQGADDRARRLGIEGRTRANQPADLAKASLELECISEPGSKFQYGPSHFYAFCELLNRKLGARRAKGKGDLPATTGEYLQRRIFDELGMSKARIGRDRAGNPNLPGGGLVSARDWVKFGQFVLDGGRVRGPDGAKKSVLAPELLAQCFEPSNANGAYGLTWWLRNSPEGAVAASIADMGGGPAGEGDAVAGRRRERLGDRLRDGAGQSGQAARQADQNLVMTGPHGKPVTVYMAAGLGKQRLYVVPQRDMVVVRFAEATSEGRGFDDRAFLGPILGLDPVKDGGEKAVP
jgi:CubicO group peptidase (beta-lactamase class C family)